MKLEYSIHELQLAHEWTIASRLKESADHPGKRSDDTIILTLTDETGIIGLGEAAPSLRYQEDIGSCEAFLKQMDPGRLNFKALQASLEYVQSITPFNRAAAGAVDVALLDGASQHAGQSLHDFLNLPFENGRYLTSFSIGIDEPQVIETKVREADAFPILKLKIGSPNDRSNFQSLRRAAPEKIVRLDANEGWKSKEEALRNIEWFAQDERVEFIEQPMPSAFPVEDHAWLKARSPLPVFADESYIDAGDVETCKAGFHGVNVKLVKTAGITKAKEALEAAKRAGLKTMIGCMIETSVLITAAAHLAALADYLDLDGNLLITNDPYQGAIVRNGRLYLNQTTPMQGLGIRPLATSN